MPNTQDLLEVVSRGFIFDLLEKVHKDGINTLGGQLVSFIETTVLRILQESYSSLSEFLL